MSLCVIMGRSVNACHRAGTSGKSAPRAAAIGQLSRRC